MGPQDSQPPPPSGRLGALYRPLDRRVPVCGCPRLSAAVRGYPPLSSAVRGCPRLSEAVRGCPRLSAAVLGCPRLSVVVGHECHECLTPAIATAAPAAVAASETCSTPSQAPSRRLRSPSSVENLSRRACAQSPPRHVAPWPPLPTWPPLRWPRGRPCASCASPAAPAPRQPSPAARSR